VATHQQIVKEKCTMSAELTGQSTRKRLQEIEKELADLKEKKSALHQRWKAEKESISRIRDLKAEIEQLRNKAVELERKGDLAKVAEIRYGTILQLEQQVESENKHLEELQATGKMLKEEVDASDIAEIVGKWTGIPVQRMLETERTKLLTMEDRIQQRVISQTDAIKAISNAIRRSRAGLQDANRPIGSFIFLGTTGIGKTEMARALAEFLFDDESAMIRIDMSEYMEKHAVSRLIGAPPGYVGYDEGGQLTEAVRQRPYSVILLDEIEKAHPEVFNILLQVLDDGRLTDSKGREVNFKNTIIIMTSNIGTEILQDSLAEINEENRESILMEARTGIINVMKQRMRPEFLNRIDEIILFKPLTKSEVRQIAVLQMKKLQE
jgi:ATP-dependent Clp protease ATP-binding subunit ClpB